MRASSVFALAAAAAAAAPQAFAALYVIAPTASTTCTAGQPCDVKWNDDGTAPTLASMGVCSISLGVGSPTQQTMLQPVAGPTDVSTVAAVTFIPNASVGPNSDVYFIKFVSTTAKDPSNPTYPATAYSHHFTLAGMTGTFNSTIQAQIAAATGVTSSAPATTTSSGAPSGTTTPAGTATTSKPGTTTTHSSTTGSAAPSGTAKSNGAGKFGVSSVAGTLGGLAAAVLAFAL